MANSIVNDKFLQVFVGPYVSERTSRTAFFKRYLMISITVRIIINNDFCTFDYLFGTKYQN